MIHKVFSSLPSFKSLEFEPGLNVLIAKKEAGATDRQTRNRAGKSSLIEIIHFLCGSKAEKDSLFRLQALKDVTFGMEFDLGGQRTKVERTGNQKNKINIEGSGAHDLANLSNSEWLELLGEKTFGLNTGYDDSGRSPTFRSLYSYFVRREHSKAFLTPEKQAAMQQAGDYQMALLYLLGLDWKIPRDWQNVREREKTLKELRKAAGKGVFGSLIGKASDLRTQLAVAEEKLKTLKEQIAQFKVLPQYRDLEKEADQITEKLNHLSNANVIDNAAIRDLEQSLKVEAPPSFGDLDRIYKDVGVTLPELALRRYEEVHSFHESVIRNRHDYIESELQTTKQRIANREQEMMSLDNRRSEIMELLKTHGALDQFSRLQGEVGRVESEVESLRQRYQSAEQLEGTKNELEIERNTLVLRLRRDFTEQAALLKEAILAYESISSQLYESAGSMNIEVTSNGPVFDFPMQGSRSKGIKNMQIFCFDMMLMKICQNRGIGPGYLVHDSHLFDGVDGRQIISALKVGARTAQELGFQYIVTMNEDDAYKETTDEFNVDDYVLPVVLTDAREDGGLFGFRF